MTEQASAFERGLSDDWQVPPGLPRAWSRFCAAWGFRERATLRAVRDALELLAGARGAAELFGQTIDQHQGREQLTKFASALVEYLARSPLPMFFEPEEIRARPRVSRHAPDL